MDKEIETQFREHLKTLEKFKRETYLPQIQDVKLDFSSKSKFGGLPYLVSEKDWVICPNCKKPMQFFLQLNLAELPINKGDGLFQLFYCLDDIIPECRVVSIKEESKELDLNIDGSPYPQKEIIGWEVKDDFPHFEDYWDLEIDEIEDEVDLLMREREIGNPFECNKLFGWASWEQESAYPIDENTGEEMKLFFQIASEENIPYMFGDDGIFYIFYSNENEYLFKTDEAGG